MVRYLWKVFCKALSLQLNPILPVRRERIATTRRCSREPILYQDTLLVNAPKPNRLSWTFSRFFLKLELLLFQMRESDPNSPPLFDYAQTSNTSRTLLDHVSVSVEAQAIIGGVVGFWGGVFGMGLVYLLVVFLRRFRKQWSDSRNNSAIPSRSLLDKAGYSAMFGQARNNASIDLMDIPTSTSAHQSSLTTVPESTASSSVPTTAPTSHRMPRTKPFHKTSSHAFGLGSSTSSSIGGHGGGGGGFGGSGGGTRLKFSGFGLGSMRDDGGGGMADCQL